MCGIVGYVGKQNAAPLLLEGLKKLEYRGYDSAGIALMSDGCLMIHKRTGRVSNLDTVVDALTSTHHTGIAHTRWATHGAVTETNAHPHVDESKLMTLVHNGVVENYNELKQQLLNKGHVFESQTDTEVLTHWIGHHLHQMQQPTTLQTLTQAIGDALVHVHGTYGLCLMHQHVPDVVVGVRCGSPLVVGIGQGENFIASDVIAITKHVNDVVYLDDHQMVVVTPDNIKLHTLNGAVLQHTVEHVATTFNDDSCEGYPHHMIKEIHQQPSVVINTMHNRLDHLNATATIGDIINHQRVILTGCGTAAHACMVGEYLMEHISRTPAEVEFASELRYRNAPTDHDTLVIAVSQSGETADTLAALRESRKHHQVLSITNNSNSPIARESDSNIHMCAGTEVGVAATKSFVAQCTILTMMSLFIGRQHHLTHQQGLSIIRELEAIPGKIQAILDMNDHIRDIAIKYSGASSMMFMGRQFNYPVAMEGALKMKEVSYIHASGHPSAELKHGVIALITPEVPSVFIAPEDSVFEKNLSNIEEVRARGGKVIGIGTQGSHRLQAVCDDVVLIPECPEYLAPLLTVVPLQLLAYHTAVVLGRDVDRPRNLAKSVTVE